MSARKVTSALGVKQVCISFILLYEIDGVELMINTMCSCLEAKNIGTGRFAVNGCQYLKKYVSGTVVLSFDL